MNHFGNIFNFGMKSSKDNTRVNKSYDEDKQNNLMLNLKYANNSLDIDRYFNKLYDSLVNQLWNSFARKFIPPLTVDEMKDIFQDSWIRVIETRNQFDETKKAYSWIYIIFKNIIIDRIRFIDRKKTQSMDKLEDNSDDDIGMQFKSSVSSEADFDIQNKEKLFFIKKAINDINNELDRDIIIKRLVENKKFEIISKELNVPITTIHYRLNKTLEILRKKLNFLIK